MSASRHIRPHGCLCVPGRHRPASPVPISQQRAMLEARGLSYLSQGAPRVKGKKRHEAEGANAKPSKTDKGHSNFSLLPPREPGVRSRPLVFVPSSLPVAGVRLPTRKQGYCVPRCTARTATACDERSARPRVTRLPLRRPAARKDDGTGTATGESLCFSRMRIVALRLPTQTPDPALSTGKERGRSRFGQRISQEMGLGRAQLQTSTRSLIGVELLFSMVTSRPAM